MKSLRARINAARCEKVPAGWYTLEQVATRERVSRDYALHLCRQATACRPALMQRRDFCVHWGNLIRKRPHYRYL